jgi:hypothetical protein
MRALLENPLGEEARRESLTRAPRRAFLSTFSHREQFPPLFMPSCEGKVRERQARLLAR